LSTPLIADACQRLGVACRFAAGIEPLIAGPRLTGAALPVRHSGSVDVFFEAIEIAAPGDVLLIDNQDRRDEGCIGDLTVLEAQAAGLSGIVVWGAVRDVPELLRIGFPVYCTGRCPLGPAGPRPRSGSLGSPVSIGSGVACKGDLVFADDDGVLLVDPGRAAAILELADEIGRKERAQAQRVQAGRSLREQFQFREYLKERGRNPSYSLREHLQRHGHAIET
jgi:regulator of RNase E activity RraA